MIKNLLDDDNPPPAAPLTVNEKVSAADSGTSNFERSEREDKFVLSEAPPQSIAETVRQSGLAWSAAIALFSSVVFLLILGWLLDLLLGSSPWGVVGGIILGSVIGFVQFFRITSQIFKK